APAVRNRRRAVLLGVVSAAGGASAGRTGDGAEGALRVTPRHLPQHPNPRRPLEHPCQPIRANCCPGGFAPDRLPPPPPPPARARTARSPAAAPPCSPGCRTTPAASCPTPPPTAATGSPSPPAATANERSATS